MLGSISRGYPAISSHLDCLIFIGIAQKSHLWSSSVFCQDCHIWGVNPIVAGSIEFLLLQPTFFVKPTLYISVGWSSLLLKPKFWVLQSHKHVHQMTVNLPGLSFCIFVVAFSGLRGTCNRWFVARPVPGHTILWRWRGIKSTDNWLVVSTHLKNSKEVQRHLKNMNWDYYPT